MFQHHVIPIKGVARVGLSVPATVTEDATGNVYRIERGQADAAGAHTLHLVREYTETRTWEHEVQVGWTKPGAPKKPADWPEDEPWEPVTPPAEPIMKKEQASEDVKRVERRTLGPYTEAPAGWTFGYPTPAEIVARWTPTAQAAVTGPGRRVSKDDVPGNPEYRDCWRDNGSAIVEDMSAAQSIHMGRIRAARDAKLVALDVDQLRYTGDPSKAAQLAAVIAEKQVLRDLPQTFDLSSATSVDELKALWPEELVA